MSTFDTCYADSRSSSLPYAETTNRLEGLCAATSRTQGAGQGRQGCQAQERRLLFPDLSKLFLDYCSAGLDPAPHDNSILLKHQFMLP
jgi:hypothetical protein